MHVHYNYNVLCNNNNARARSILTACTLHTCRIKLAKGLAQKCFIKNTMYVVVLALSKLPLIVSHAAYILHV